MMILRLEWFYGAKNKIIVGICYPAEKNNRNHYRIPNGFNGYKGKCIGFNGNCNGYRKYNLFNYVCIFPSGLFLLLCFSKSVYTRSHISLKEAQADHRRGSRSHDQGAWFKTALKTVKLQCFRGDLTIIIFISSLSNTLKIPYDIVHKHSIISLVQYNSNSLYGAAIFRPSTSASNTQSTSNWHSHSQSTEHSEEPQHITRSSESTNTHVSVALSVSFWLARVSLCCGVYMLWCVRR